MQENEKAVEPEIVDVQFVEDDTTLRGAPSIVEIPHRAAHALDALADTVSQFSPEKGGELRHKAAVMRSLGENVQTAQVAGGKLMDALKEGAQKLEKLGLKFEMVQRRVVHK